jgi:hypothetical protein
MTRKHPISRRRAGGTEADRLGRLFVGDLVDPHVIGRLLSEFLNVSFSQQGPELLNASRTLAGILAGEDPGYQPSGQWNPSGLAAHLRRELPQATKKTEDDVTAIQEVVVLGALVSRHLLQQAASKDQAAAYLRLFLQDWTRLMLGIPMQRRWVEAPHSAGDEPC